MIRYEPFYLNSQPVYIIGYLRWGSYGFQHAFLFPLRNQEFSTRKSGKTPNENQGNPDFSLEGTVIFQKIYQIFLKGAIHVFSILPASQTLPEQVPPNEIQQLVVPFLTFQPFPMLYNVLRKDLLSPEWGGKNPDSEDLSLYF